MRSLIIQSENDNGDLAEMRDGVLHGLGFTEEEKNVVLRDILVSNLVVARLVLSPSARPQPAWVPVPLDIRHPGAITLLATIITTTPGTVSCVVDEAAHRILVHALDGSAGAEAIAADIKARYEAPLKEIFE